MHYPEFYEQVEPIRMYDPLAETLGAFEGGLLEVGYLDVVRLAGHSCPTVAGAFLSARFGLRQLYGEQLPVRGEVRVEMREPIGEGVCGVIANVLSMITGATDEGGFHGLAGRFDRRALLAFGQDNPAPVTMQRLDTGDRISVRYDPSFVPADPQVGELFPLVLSGRADSEQAALFATLWQQRVKMILCDYAEDPRLLTAV